MRVGKVYLIGAGPGDPGLLTIRGLQLLQRADVVVYDHLVNPSLLEEASSVAVRIFAGKKAGKHGVTQEEINRILVEYARLNCCVVRLKGGDPFVFGRGGEEAQALVRANIPFEVVPGVSSAIAVPAYSGIPLTHRELASSFAVVTGHEAGNKNTVDWAKLAGSVDTLVILMGLKNLAAITANLMQHGLSPRTPAAVIVWGTTGEQRTVSGTLGDIREKAHDLSAPAVIVIGKVVELGRELAWFSPAPSLAGASPASSHSQAMTML